MKRLLFLFVCILLLGVTAANAEVIQVSADRTVFDGTWDKVVLKIVAFVGADVPMPGYATNGLLGTWTCAAGMSLPGNATTWKTNTLNAGDSQAPATALVSWLDFSTHSPDTQTRLGTSPYYTGFTAGFSSTLSATNGYALGPVDVTPGEDGEAEGYAFDNTLLGVFYIRHTDTSWVPGATIFTGSAGYCRNDQPGSLGAKPTTVEIVPEPSTLALLGCGLFGLLAYAWRKRK